MADNLAQDQRERELKFDVPEDWVLPDPSRLAPDGGSVERETVRLETTYFDTVDHALFHNRLTLRRRTGDSDTGWQLKVPDGDARVEIRLPLSGRGVPEELRKATLGVRSRAVLKPLAILTTEREIHRVLDGEGRPLAELVVDSVTSAAALDAAVIRQWREVEVELVGGDERLLGRAAKWLVKRGAEPSASGSKLARALALDAREEPDAAALSGLVSRYLDRQHEAIVRGDIALRRGQDAIHKTRVATRRYRSVLRVFADLFDPGRAAALDAELAWYAAALGEVRDRQVLRAHLDDVLADLPPELILGPVAARIHQTLLAEHLQADADLAALMGARRYFDLLTELRSWRAQLPIVQDGSATAVKRYVGKAEAKVRRRLRRARRDHTDEAVHRARKAAKRARYAAELSRPALGKRGRATAKRLKKQQQRLGEHQDGAVAAEFLRRVAAVAGVTAGENGFTFGLMYERERSRGQLLPEP